MSDNSRYQTKATKELLEGWVHFLNNVNFQRSNFDATSIQFMNNFSELVRKVEVDAIAMVREN